MKSNEKVANILVDISEYDIELFKSLINDVLAEIFWTYESEEGIKVNITFRKEQDDK